MSMIYNDNYDSTGHDNRVDLASKPTVKAAQVKLDLARAEVVRLETTSGDIRGLNWEQRNNLINQNRDNLAVAGQAVEDARLELFQVQSAALDAPYKVEREAAAVRDREQFEAKQQAKRDGDLAQAKAEMKGIYMLQPGATEEAFERAFPGLLEERNRRAVLSGQDIARRAQFNLMHEIA